MGRTAKIVIFITTGLITLSGIIIIGLVMLVDPNQYKSAIFSAIEKQTGARLQIDSIHWGIVGANLGFIISNVSITMNPENSPTPLATINNAKLGLNLIELLHKKIHVNNLVINNAIFTLETNQKTNNWELNNLNQNKLDQKNYIFSLKSITINNSILIYRNLAAKSNIKLDNLNLKLDTHDDGSINYYTQGNLLSLNKVTFNLNQAIKGNLEFTYSDGIYNGTIASEQFSLIPLATSIGQYQLPPAAKSNQLQQLNITTNFNGSDKTMNINNTMITTPDSKINLKATINSFSPLSGYNSISIDKADVADYIPLKGYRLKIRNMLSSGNFSEQNGKLIAEQNVQISNLTLYGYNLHNLSMKIATILSNPLKIISVPETVSQIQSSITAANSKGNKDLNLVSNLGSLTSHVNYRDIQIENQDTVLNGPDLRARASGYFNTKSRYLNYQLNAQFVAASDTLTGKIIYPVTVSGPINDPQNNVDWGSVNRQIARNLGSSLINTGKDVGKATGSTMEKIGSKIKNWF